jgi:putative ABC transport system permease protein
VVVGVARDVKYRTLGEQPEPHIYLPLAQSYSPSMTLLVSADGAPEPLVATVPRLLRQEWPGVGAFFPRTLRQHMGFSLLPARLGALLAGLAGALALLLAAIGIYAVMSQSVAQRAREVAVRMALGATRGQITSLILGRGLRVAAAGLAAGLVLALGVARLLATQLYGIRPTDAVTFAGVTLLLLAIAAIASWLPARRAASASPSLVLRSS